MKRRDGIVKKGQKCPNLDKRMQVKGLDLLERTCSKTLIQKLPLKQAL